MTPKITQHVVPRSYRSQNNRRSGPWLRQRGSINPATITITLALGAVIAVASLSFFYLGQVQHTAGQGANIYNLEEEIVELRQRQKALELEGARLRSIETIERNVPQLNLVASDRVTYLTSVDDRVARAQ